MLRVEDRRVAVGSGERFGHRALRQPGDLVEHRAHRVGIEIAVAARSENVAELQHLEQVELDVTDIGDVVAQRQFPPPSKLEESVAEQGKRTQA